jgi:hypothetical protein
MRIIALMLVKNEDWIIGASLRMALEWCDGAVIMDDDSKDGTMDEILDICAASPKDTSVILKSSSFEYWNEMDLRQELLVAGREFKGTHYALIDADEMITANILPDIRGIFSEIQIGEVLNVPMVPIWRDLDHYRNDASVWSRSQLSIGFADTPALHWKARNGYHHHHRAPFGVSTQRMHPLANGGAMHLQFANWKRLKAKHAWYKMTEKLRWPDKEPVHKLNAKYNQALDETNIKVSQCPKDWWKEDHKQRINLDGQPWFEEECRKLLEEHGPEKFEGLELWGVPDGEY